MGLDNGEENYFSIIHFLMYKMRNFNSINFPKFLSFIVHPHNLELHYVYVYYYFYLSLNRLLFLLSPLIKKNSWKHEFNVPFIYSYYTFNIKYNYKIKMFVITNELLFLITNECFDYYIMKNNN